jgi:hypothetical protein
MSFDVTDQLPISFCICQALEKKESTMRQYISCITQYSHRDNEVEEFL